MNKKHFFCLAAFLFLNSCSKLEDAMETAQYEWGYFTEFCASIPEYILRAFSMSNKDKLDHVVGEYWKDWKSAGNDTLNCIVDFDKIMPFEWDTLVYIKYDSYSGNSSDELEEYLNFYFGNKKRRSVNGLHFLHKGKVVHKVNLYMMSDDAKGFFLCTEKDFIKRARSDAKFHLIRDSRFFVVRDTAENFVPMITF